MSFPRQYLDQLRAALDTLDLAKVEEAIAWFREARDAGRTIFVCGNGGSATTASHFATDILKGASYGRERRFRILALTDSVPTLTAYANDVSYDCAFAEQLKNFARPGDLVMAISGSGESANVVCAVEYANSIGCRTLALTGRDGGRLAGLAQLSLHVPEPHMGRIEDVHLVLCHMICYQFMDAEGGLKPAAG
jgi:D-sedoheptulose 7-phosphate isomerase